MTAESSWEAFNQGPVGFQALGTISGAAAPAEAPAEAPAPASARTAVAASVHGARVSVRRARVRRAHRAGVSRAHVMIEGLPGAVVAGTSVQLSALVVRAQPALAWRVSAGSITRGGLFTAPAQLPRGGAVVLSASSRGGGRDRRRVAILPAAAVQAEPAATQPSSHQPLVPQAELFLGKLVMTAWFDRPGRARISAYVGQRLLGQCVAPTLAAGSATCRVSLRGTSRKAPIAIAVTLQSGGRTLTGSRAAAPVAEMKMPTSSIAGTMKRLLGKGYAASAWQYLCGAGAQVGEMNT
jgi:hypothetical protein